MKILAVEDDAVSRAVLRKALHRLNHDVIEAADGEQAWEKLQTEPVRVVVSDWMMPRSDGLDLCRRIRAGRGKDYTYFILLTSRDATEENQRAAADAGVDDFLTKPLDLPEQCVPIFLHLLIDPCFRQPLDLGLEAGVLGV